MKNDIICDMKETNQERRQVRQESNLDERSQAGFSANEVLQYEEERGPGRRNHMSKGPDGFPHLSCDRDFIKTKVIILPSLERRYM